MNDAFSCIVVRGRKFSVANDFASARPMIILQHKAARVSTKKVAVVLWRSVKYEKIYLEEFETVRELIAGLREYFRFYNFERPHQSFSGQTPAEMYWGEQAGKMAA